MINALNSLFRYLFRHSTWRIGVVKSSPNKILTDGLDSCSFKWLEFNTSAVNADPFILNRSGDHYVFYEDFSCRTNVKMIRWVRIDDHLAVVGHGETQGLPSHTSYPFLLEHNDTVYCIPEAHQTHTISLYAASSFPVKWEKACTMIDRIDGIDPTLFKHEDNWWLFYANKTEKPDEKLFLSFSNRLVGPYRPHPQNPIVVDPSSARPAGNLFHSDGTFFRPGQDCHDKYGSAVAVNEIIELNERVYRERKIAILRPLTQWKHSDGFHTLSFCNGLVAIDARSVHFQAAAFFRRLLSLLTKANR